MALQFPLPNILRLCQQVTFTQRGGDPCWAPRAGGATYFEGEVRLDVNERILPLLNPTILTLNLAGYKVTRVAFRIQSSTLDMRHFLETSLSTFQFTNHPLDANAFPRPWDAVTGIKWSGSGFAFGRIPASTALAVAFAVTRRPAHRDSRETFAIPLDDIQLSNVTFGNAVDLSTSTVQQWLCLAVDEVHTGNYTTPPFLWSALQDLEAPLEDLEAAIGNLLVARWRRNDGAPEGLLHIFSPYRYNTQPFEFAMPDNWGWGSPDCWLGGKSWRTSSSLIDQFYEVWKPFVQPHQAPEQECGGFLGLFSDAGFPASEVVKLAQELTEAHLPPGISPNSLPAFTLADIIDDVRNITLSAQQLDDQFEYTESDRLIAAIGAGIIPNDVFFTSARDRLVNERRAHSDSIANAARHRLENLDKLTWAELLMCLHDLQVIDILGLGGPDILLPWQPEDHTGYYNANDMSDNYTAQLNQAGDYITGYVQLRIPKAISTDLGINLYIGNPPVQLYANEYFSDFQLYLLTYSSTDPALGKVAPLYPIHPPESSTPLTPNNSLAVSIDRWEKVAQQSGGAFVIRVHLAKPLVLQGHGNAKTPSELVLKRIETRPFISEDNYLHLPTEIGAELRSDYRYPLTEWEWDSILQVIPLLSQYLLERSGNNQLYRTMYPDICDRLSSFAIFDANGALFRQGEQWLTVKEALFSLAQLTSFNSFSGFTNIYVAVSQFLRELTTWTILDTLIMNILGITQSNMVDFTSLVPSAGAYKYEWQMMSGGASIEATLGVEAGIGLAHIRTIGYPNNANPDAIFDSWYYVRFAKGVPPFPFGGGGYGFDFGITVSEWSSLEASEAWSSDDFVGGALNLTAWATSGAVIVGYSTDEDWIIFFEPGHQPIVAQTENAYLIGLAIEFETLSIAVLRFVKLLDQPKVDPYMLPWQSSTVFSTENSNKNVVYFSPPGSSTLSAQGKQILRMMVAQFRSGFESPHSSLSILGFASRSGQTDENQVLSERRARVTYDFMYSLLAKAFRIPTNNISVRGYGERMAEFAGQADKIEDPDWRKVEVRLNGVLISRLYGEAVTD
jgi:outer membrane protein OmpA-like peptidoglycan-associated protein